MKNSIGLRIKEVREDRKLSQEEFAKRLSMGRSHISMVERGLRNATSRFIREVSREFDVNESWIKTGEGAKYLPNPHPNKVKEMVDMFSELNISQQESIMQLMKSMADEN